VAEPGIRGPRDRGPTDGEIRSEAVRIVDERHGWTYEFSNQPNCHLIEYDEEERRLLAERDGG
jgi:hypothetical protein